MGTSASTDRKGFRETVPGWVYTVKIPPEFAYDQMGACSDGMSLVGPNTVTRHRSGHHDTDGARWNRGFTSGKHTFEVVFPMAFRGTDATVGVATEDAALYAKGKSSLVGSNKSSWGICLRTRRAFHKNSIVKKYPQTQVFLPDKFYMYLDADQGTLLFGSDLDYYGTALFNIPRGQQPLYPMVGATVKDATITMVYRGKGDTAAIGPPPPCVVPAGPQMMSPGLRMEPPPPPPPTMIPPPEPEPTPVQKISEAPPPAASEPKSSEDPPPADEGESGSVPTAPPAEEAPESKES